ncbi:MAG: hypothetical protein ACTHNY_06650 [Solirubrobacterales bacterium]
MRRGVAVAVLMVALALPATASAATRYASTFGGTVPGCPQVAPCSLEKAIAEASPGDEIVVLSGTYDVGTTIGTEMPLFIHGEDGLPRPRIVGAPGVTPFKSFAPQHLGYLTVEASGSGANALFVPGNGTVLERLELVAHGEGSLALRPGVNFTLTNSVLWAEGLNAGGIFIQGTTSGTPVLRNDTIVASGAESFAVATTVVNNDTAVAVQAVNVIADAQVDASANVAPEKTNSSATMAFDHSNLDKTEGAVTSTNGQTAPPQFVASNPPTFEEAPGSPTIDAGIDDPANGPLDLAGRPRSLPPASTCTSTPPAVTDIGAYEYPAPSLAIGCPRLLPPETTITRLKRHGRRAAFFFTASGTLPAVFECRLDRKPFRPCRSPRVYKHLKPGRHVFRVRAIAGGSTDPTPAKRKFRIGRPHRHHHGFAPK